jgi:hypothetical protein
MSERCSDAAIQDYVATKGVVILASIEADGTPLMTPMWFWHDHEAIVMVTPRGTRKARNVMRDPRVTVLAESGTDSPRPSCDPLRFPDAHWHRGCHHDPERSSRRPPRICCLR